MDSCWQLTEHPQQVPVIVLAFVIETKYISIILRDPQKIAHDKLCGSERDT